jgi:hypothetical protein
LPINVPLGLLRMVLYLENFMGFRHNVYVFRRIVNSEVWSEVAFGALALLVAIGVKLLIAGYDFGRSYPYVPSVQIRVVDLSIEMIFIGFGTLVNSTLSWWRSKSETSLHRDEAVSVGVTFLAACASVVVALFLIVLSFSLWPGEPPEQWISVGQQLSYLVHYLLTDLVGLVVLASAVSMSQKVRTYIED